MLPTPYDRTEGEKKNHDTSCAAMMCVWSLTLCCEIHVMSAAVSVRRDEFFPNADRRPHLDCRAFKYVLGFLVFTMHHWKSSQWETSMNVTRD